MKKIRKPKFEIHYGRGGVQKCYTRKDISDFLAYLAATEAQQVSIVPVKR